MDVAIVDYGVSNLYSVVKAVEYLGYEAQLTARPEDLAAADRLLLPGQGAFGAAMASLEATGLVEVLREQVLQKGKPLMGICVGMQILARSGLENGGADGLGYFDAVVGPMEPADPTLKLPHVGWNELHYNSSLPLFRGLKAKDPCVYFVHSYAMFCAQPDEVVATFDYGRTFPAAVLKGTIFATQFHPEKSQENGLRILDNFLAWKP